MVERVSRDYPATALTRKRCDALVSLPMLGRVASLNAAAAGAVLLYEAARQRDFRAG